MRNRWSIALLAAAVLLGNAGAVRLAVARTSAEILTFPDYFPLKPGTVCTYRVTDTDGNTGTGQVVVGKPTNSREFDGPVTPMAGLTPDGLVGGVAYFSSDSTLGFRYHGVDDPDCIGRFRPPSRIPNGMKKGEFFDQVTKTVVTDRNPNDDIECGSGTDTTRTTIAGLETVTTPAGTFQNCAKIIIEGTSADDEGNVDKGTHIIYFALGVGIVKELDPDPDAGYVVELVSCR